jgi:hypothetical protein
MSMQQFHQHLIQTDGGDALWQALRRLTQGARRPLNNEAAYWYVWQ